MHARGHDVESGSARRRVLVDALLFLCEADVAETIVDDAIAMSGRADVPSVADGLRAFVQGHLLDAIEARLGADAADRIEESIDAILRAAGQQQESGAAPARGMRGGLVVVASSDPRRVAQIAHALAVHCDVEPIEDGALIPSVLWARLASAIVIDWARSPLDGAAIDEIVAGMGDVRVVLWGAPPEVEEAFARASGAWIGCGRAASAAHVAAIVLALVSG